MQQPNTNIDSGLGDESAATSNDINRSEIDASGTSKTDDTSFMTDSRINNDKCIMSNYNEDFEKSTNEDKSIMLKSNFDQSFTASAYPSEYGNSMAPSNFGDSYEKSAEDKSAYLQRTFEENSYNVSATDNASTFDMGASKFTESYDVSVISNNKSEMLAHTIEEKSYVVSEIAKPITAKGKKDVIVQPKLKEISKKKPEKIISKISSIKKAKKIDLKPSDIKKSDVKPETIPSAIVINETSKNKFDLKDVRKKSVKENSDEEKSIAISMFGHDYEKSAISEASFALGGHFDDNSYMNSESKSAYENSFAPSNFGDDYNKSMLSTNSMMSKSNADEDSNYMNSVYSERSAFENSIAPSNFGDEFDKSMVSENSIMLGGNIDEKSYMNSEMSGERSMMSNVLQDDMDGSFNQSIMSNVSRKSIASKTSHKDKRINQTGSQASPPQPIVNSGITTNNADKSETTVVSKSIKSSKVKEKDLKKQQMDEKLKILNEGIEKRSKTVKTPPKKIIRKVASDSSLSVEEEKGIHAELSTLSTLSGMHEQSYVSDDVSVKNALETEKSKKETKAKDPPSVKDTKDNKKKSLNKK